jgi:hypothetical protein
MTTDIAETDRSDWQPARLIPVAGIRGQEEQETRAASALLAVLRAVPEFAFALLASLGAPKGRVETFTEVRFKDAEGRPQRPDGAIAITRGARTWLALVEVKTGSGELGTDQVNRYLDIARDHEFDAVVTISNEITARPEDVPFTYDRRKTRRVGLFHLSWWRIVTTAVVQHRHRGVSDPDQAWILGELIAYLDHVNSGASGFQDMGRGWVRVRDAARQGTLRANDPEARDVVEHWAQYLDYVALGLSQDLGREVVPVRPRNQALTERSEVHLKRLDSEGQLVGTLRVPDAVGPIALAANLRTQQVTTSVGLDLPREGRAATRVNWLLRQLSDAPGGLRVTSAFANTRETSSVLLSEAREQPDRLLNATDPRREPRSCEIAMTRVLGVKNGRGKGSFVAETRQQVIDFYAEVVQDLSPWQPRAPKLPPRPEEVPETPQAEPPPFVAADEREIGEASLPSEPSDGRTWEQFGNTSQDSGVRVSAAESPEEGQEDADLQGLRGTEQDRPEPAE